MQKTPAFTLIEMLIVSMIIAILAVTMSVKFQGTKKNAQFDTQVQELITFFQKARGLSQSNLVVNGGEEGTSFYYIQLMPEPEDNTIFLKAYGESETILEVEELEINEDYSISMEEFEMVSILYTPPYGEVCFNTEGDRETAPGGCGGLDNSTVQFTLSSSDGEYTQSFEVSRHGGFIQEL